MITHVTYCDEQEVADATCAVGLSFLICWRRELNFCSGKEYHYTSFFFFDSCFFLYGGFISQPLQKVGSCVWNLTIFGHLTSRNLGIWSRCNSFFFFDSCFLLYGDSISPAVEKGRISSVPELTIIFRQPNKAANLEIWRLYIRWHRASY